MHSLFQNTFPDIWNQNFGPIKAIGFLTMIACTSVEFRNLNFKDANSSTCKLSQNPNTDVVTKSAECVRAEFFGGLKTSAMQYLEILNMLDSEIEMEAESKFKELLGISAVDTISSLTTSQVNEKIGVYIHITNTMHGIMSLLKDDFNVNKWRVMCRELFIANRILATLIPFLSVGEISVRSIYSIDEYKSDNLYTIYGTRMPLSRLVNSFKDSLRNVLNTGIDAWFSKRDSNGIDIQKLKEDARLFFTVEGTEDMLVLCESADPNLKLALTNCKR